MHLNVDGTVLYGLKMEAIGGARCMGGGGRTAMG